MSTSDVGFFVTFSHPHTSLALASGCFPMARAAGFYPATLRVAAQAGCAGFSGRRHGGIQAPVVGKQPRMRSIVVTSCQTKSSQSSLVFVTGNAGKVARLELALGLFCGAPQALDADTKHGNPESEITVTQLDLAIPEIQADTVREVAVAKAMAAFSVLSKNNKKQLVVHDCGLCVAALGDWPGPYTRNANGKLGTRGLLRLLEGESDRRAGWDDTIVFVDGNGAATVFGGAFSGKNIKNSLEKKEKHYAGEISTLPPQKYNRFTGPERALGRCFIPTEFGLTECLADVTEEEYQRYRREAPSVWNDFAKWFSENINSNGSGSI